MQIKLIVVGNVKEIFYQNKIEEFQKQLNKKMGIPRDLGHAGRLTEPDWGACVR